MKKQKENLIILRGKILAFLTLSTTDSETFRLPEDTSAFDGSMRKLKQQDEMVEDLRLWALKCNTMLGRIVTFPMADSYAMYVVVQVKKNVALVKWIDYCDGWQDDRLGNNGHLPLSYIEEKVRGEDKLHEMFS